MIEDMTRRGRRSDDLYFDTIGRRELCNMIARLEEKLRDAEDEMYGLRCTIGSMQKDAEKLEEINVALSELCKTMRKKGGKDVC